ncbi:MAG: uroporphyrinogen-III C-methyltransferase [Oscillospiraceae bacterium]|nr:uroporphyrinogen-III C-methyltransferase [Oscillospiraceae bacterium]
MTGKVTLVGAGPGDPGLLTVKGRRALEQADVVVYDRLVGPAVRALIPDSAKAIDVGKEASRHLIPQDQINEILLREAREGHNVVRLKGGDPFVFGRGGEELEALARGGIAFEVVPGVTSAIAAAAYGGIPVTHREHSSSFHIITGRARRGMDPNINYKALVEGGGTLVFLMSVSAAPKIVQGLSDAGMPFDTPAAMVENGTLPTQRRCDASLGTLLEKAGEMAIRSPALLIVGEVCALGPLLCWFDRLPLHGKRILVTRPKNRAGTLSDRLRDLGADVWEFPCIETVPIEPCLPMEAALRDVGRYAWLAFTSPTGVEIFWKCLRGMGKDARALNGVRLAAIGSATAKALEHCGLSADLVPEIYDAAHLGAALAERSDGKVLLLRAEEGSAALTEQLERKKIAFDDIHIYRTRCGGPQADELKNALAERRLDYVTFTSASTVKGFIAAAGPGASGITGLCIGEQTAAEAKKHQIPVKIAKHATIDALVELAAELSRQEE